MKQQSITSFFTKQSIPKDSNPKTPLPIKKEITPILPNKATYNVQSFDMKRNFAAF